VVAVNKESLLNKILLNNKMEMLEHGLATFAAAFSRLSMFFIVLMNTQFLSPEDFGIFTLLLLTSNIVNAFVSCGGDMWLNRFTRHYHSHKKRAPIIARFYLQISLGIAALVGVVALGFGVCAPDSFNGNGLAIALSLVWAGSAGLIETILAILRTTNEIKRFFLIRDFVLPMLLILAILIFDLRTTTAFFLTASIIWGTALGLLFRYILRGAALYIPRSSLITWHNLGKGLIFYTCKLIMNNFSARLSNAFDTLILARYLPIEMVGKYRLGSQLSNAFIVVQHFVFLTLPWHLRAVASVSPEHQGARMVKIRQMMLLLTALPALVFLLLFIKPLLGILGTGYQIMAAPVCAFLLIRFSELLWGPQHEILISNNRNFSDTLANLCGLLMGIISFMSALFYFDAIISGVISAGLSSVTAQCVRFYILRTSSDFRKMSSKTSKTYLPWLPLLVTFFGISYVVLK
jgi:O-antigen/teichoic acid export membrane protein